MIPYLPIKSIEIFGAKIFMHDFFWNFGFAVGMIFTATEFIKNIRTNNKVLKLLLLFLTLYPMFILGTRFLYNLGPWSSHPWYYAFNLSANSGHAFFGGYYFGIIALYTASKILGINPLKVLDYFSIGLALTMFFGRIGCFFHGCCYGKITSPGIFTLDYVNEGISRYATQNISSIYNLGIFAFLYWYKPRKKFDGELALLFIIIYSIFRFFVEFIRYDEFYYLGLSFMQYVAIANIIIGSLIYYKSIENFE
jgi:phosphatidylglycerol:prolipoprotein diacylglycerol transferase